MVSPPSQLIRLTFEDLILLENLSVNVSLTSSSAFRQSPELQSNLEIASGRELVKAPYLRRLAVVRSWVPKFWLIAVLTMRILMD
ncbi:hypothetical protein H1R20_g6756, partial [Candolleomyces eurysporus]